jgi:hypothetical protein
MSDPFNSFDFKVENYLNWVNTVAKKADANRRRNKPRPRAKVRRTAWGCALPSSVIGVVLLALVMQIVV